MIFRSVVNRAVAKLQVASPVLTGRLIQAATSRGGSKSKGPTSGGRVSGLAAAAVAARIEPDWKPERTDGIATASKIAAITPEGARELAGS